MTLKAIILEKMKDGKRYTSSTLFEALKGTPKETRIENIGSCISAMQKTNVAPLIQRVRKPGSGDKRKAYLYQLRKEALDIPVGVLEDMTRKAGPRVEQLVEQYPKLKKVAEGIADTDTVTEEIRQRAEQDLAKLPGSTFGASSGSSKAAGKVPGLTVGKFRLTFSVDVTVEEL